MKLYINIQEVSSKFFFYFQNNCTTIIRDNEMKLRLTEILLNIETIYHILRYYISLQIAVTQHLIYILHVVSILSY